MARNALTRPRWLRPTLGFGRTRRTIKWGRAMNILVVIVAALAFCYLTYAILYPEQF